MTEGEAVKVKFIIAYLEAQETSEVFDGNAPISILEIYIHCEGVVWESGSRIQCGCQLEAHIYVFVEG